MPVGSTRFNLIVRMREMNRRAIVQNDHKSLVLAVATTNRGVGHIEYLDIVVEP
jgi:hypothetical protein